MEDLLGSLPTNLYTEYTLGHHNSNTQSNHGPSIAILTSATIRSTPKVYSFIVRQTIIAVALKKYSWNMIKYQLVSTGSPLN